MLCGHRRLSLADHRERVSSFCCAYLFILLENWRWNCSQVGEQIGTRPSLSVNRKIGRPYTKKGDQDRTRGKKTPSSQITSTVHVKQLTKVGFLTTSPEHHRRWWTLASRSEPSNRVPKFPQMLSRLLDNFSHFLFDCNSPQSISRLKSSNVHFCTYVLAPSIGKIVY